jgi:hypothetical protein
MATDTLEPHESPNVVTLVGDIIRDAQELTKQQFELFKVEVKEEAKKAQAIATYGAIAGLTAMVAGVVLAFALSGWLAYAIPSLPDWGALGIVGLVLAVSAGILFGVCKQHLDSFNPLPEKSVESLKENLEWKTKPN